jgi:hypothetical protein
VVETYDHKNGVVRVELQVKDNVYKYLEEHATQVIWVPDMLQDRLLHNKTVILNARARTYHGRVLMVIVFKNLTVYMLH